MESRAARSLRKYCASVHESTRFVTWVVVCLVMIILSSVVQFVVRRSNAYLGYIIDFLVCALISLILLFWSQIQIDAEVVPWSELEQRQTRKRIRVPPPGAHTHTQLMQRLETMTETRELVTNVLEVARQVHRDKELVMTGVVDARRCALWADSVDLAYVADAFEGQVPEKAAVFLLSQMIHRIADLHADNTAVGEFTLKSFFISPSGIVDLRLESCNSSGPERIDDDLKCLVKIASDFLASAAREAPSGNTSRKESIIDLPRIISLLHETMEGKRSLKSVSGKLHEMVATTHSVASDRMDEVKNDVPV